MFPMKRSSGMGEPGDCLSMQQSYRSVKANTVSRKWRHIRRPGFQRQQTSGWCGDSQSFQAVAQAEPARITVSGGLIVDVATGNIGVDGSLFDTKTSGLTEAELANSWALFSTAHPRF
jgi:hypothetical protein